MAGWMAIAVELWWWKRDGSRRLNRSRAVLDALTLALSLRTCDSVSAETRCTSQANMVIHRISGQKRKTLLEFYEPNDRQFESAHVSLNAMRFLLHYLYQLDGPELFAFTSIYRLNFVDADTHKRPVIARIIPGCTPAQDGPLSPLFHIDYPPTPDVARDDRKWVLNSAETVEQAGELLLAAFDNSAFSPYSE